MSDAFEVLGTDQVLQSYIFSVTRRRVAHAGEVFERDVVVHPGAVAVVAEDGDGRVALIRQYRATVDQILWEIPAGTIDVKDPDPLATARRELLEEVGVAAAHWEDIAHVYVSPGWTDQVMHIYYASDLVDQGRRPEGPEENAAEIVWLDAEAVRRLLDEGEINDATLTIGLRHYLGRHGND